jgi:hypothetical protein
MMFNMILRLHKRHGSLQALTSRDVRRYDVYDATSSTAHDAAAV